MMLPLLAPTLVTQTAPRRPQVAIKSLPPIDAPGTKGWSRAGISPEELARRADARMAGLKNGILEWIATVDIPTGKGRSSGRSVFYAPGRFRIETLNVDLKNEDAVKNLVWRGNGGKPRVLLPTGWQNRADYRTLPQPLAPAFLHSFNDVLMRGSQGAKSVTALLASARQSGFAPIAERRRYGTYTELRLLLTKGATRYALSWREQQMLPTQVYVQSVGKDRLPIRILWSGAWGVKRTPLTAADVKNFHPSRDRRF